MATLCRSLTNATCVPNSRLCSYYLDRENSNDHTSPATMIAQGSGSLDSKAGWQKMNYWPSFCTVGKKKLLIFSYLYVLQNMIYDIIPRNTIKFLRQCFKLFICFFVWAFLRCYEKYITLFHVKNVDRWYDILNSLK